MFRLVTVEFCTVTRFGMFGFNETWLSNDWFTNCMFLSQNSLFEPAALQEW